MPKLRDLTHLQREWAHAYVAEARFNASEAARIVGMSEAEGRRLRSKPHVVAYVEELQRKRIEGRLITQDRTVEEMAAIAYSDLTDVLTITETGSLVVKDLDSLPRNVTSAIKKIKLTRRKGDGDGEFEDVLEIELHDKVKALAMMAQYQGLLAGDGASDAPTPFEGLQIVPPPGDDA
jgi:phage terminase small subunit